MTLEAMFEEERYTFKATPFMDEEERLFFLVNLPSPGFVLLEKFSKDKWVQISGVQISPQLQQLLYDTIDNADARELMKDPYPFDQLHEFYHTSLFKRN